MRVVLVGGSVLVVSDIPDGISGPTPPVSALHFPVSIRGVVHLPIDASCCYLLTLRKNGLAVKRAICHGKVTLPCPECSGEGCPSCSHTGHYFAHTEEAMHG